MRRRLAVLSLVLISGSASADGTLLYGELLGKGGPWGVGVEQPITPRFALGAVVSFAVLDGQQLFAAAPYVHAKIGRRERSVRFRSLRGLDRSHMGAPALIQRATASSLPAHSAGPPSGMKPSSGIGPRARPSATIR